jgi:hypothetical protein
MAIPIALGEIGIRLAWRRGVYGVKRSEKVNRKPHCVGVDKFKREVWLRGNIHADNFKSSAVVPNRNTPGTAK